MVSGTMCSASVVDRKGTKNNNRPPTIVNITKMNKCHMLRTVSSDDDEYDSSLQITPQATRTGSLSETFFDAAAKVESTDTFNSNIISNNNEERDDPSKHKTKKKRSLFLCCFCPASNEGIDRSDHGDEYGYSNILDFAGCNLDMSQVDFGVTDDGGNNSISYRPVLTRDCTSTIHEDEFISCCDTSEFDLETKYQDVPTLTESSTELVEEFARHIRVCNLNVHDCSAIEIVQSNEEDEMTMNTSQSSATLKNDFSPVRSTSSETQARKQGPKLTFLELTNKYDLHPKDQIYHATVIEVMNAMAQVGLGVALGGAYKSKNFSIAWKEEGSTNKLLNKIRGDSIWYKNPECIDLLEKETLVWSGMSTVTNGNTDQLGYGCKIPYFKARGIIPRISPMNLAELILDSSKVKLYNKWTNGRDDLHVFQASINEVDGLYGDGCLKVVQSNTTVPFSSTTLKIENFLHGKPLRLNHDDLYEDGKSEIESSDAPNAYIIVSRSIYTKEAVAEDEGNKIIEAVRGSKDEMIMGVNIFREVPGHPDKTDLLTVTQANSSSIPSFLSHKANMMGATDFFKNLRRMKLDDA